MLESGLRVRDTHLMGPKQWNYFREIVNSTGPMSERLDKELMTRQRVSLLKIYILVNNECWSLIILSSYLKKKLFYNMQSPRNGQLINM